MTWVAVRDGGEDILVVESGSLGLKYLSFLLYILGKIILHHISRVSSFFVSIPLITFLIPLADNGSESIE